MRNCKSGKSKWGLNVLVHTCLRLSAFVTKVLLRKGPKKPQKRRVVDDCAQISESGLKPLFESPHLDFPEQNNQEPLYAHSGIRGNGPLRSENGPLWKGNAPLALMGSFQAPHHVENGPSKKAHEEVYETRPPKDANVFDKNVPRIVSTVLSR